MLEIARPTPLAVAALFAVTLLARPRPASPIRPIPIYLPAPSEPLTVTFVTDAHMIFTPPDTNDDCVRVPTGY